MEIAWQKERVYDPQSRAVLQESETGQMYNHIYQRAARPWTWLGPEEPYIYEYRLRDGAT